MALIDLQTAPLEAAPRLELVTIPSTYYLGVVARMGAQIDPQLFLQARQLRAVEYIDRSHFLPPEARQIDGGESDIDDMRSTQFVVTEQNGDGRAVIATSRLIVKRHSEDLLPVERSFPELPDTDVGSVEASRFIARHPDKQVQSAAALALIMGMVREANENDSGNIYALVERGLEVYFKRLGMPVEALTEFRYVPHYKTDNKAVRFDPTKVIAGIEAKRPEEIERVRNLVAGLE